MLFIDRQIALYEVYSCKLSMLRKNAYCIALCSQWVADKFSRPPTWRRPIRNRSPKFGGMSILHAVHGAEGKSRRMLNVKDSTLRTLISILVRSTFVSLLSDIIFLRYSTSLILYSPQCEKNLKNLWKDQKVLDNGHEPMCVTS